MRRLTTIIRFADGGYECVTNCARRMEFSFLIPFGIPLNPNSVLRKSIGITVDERTSVAKSTLHVVSFTWSTYQMYNLQSPFRVEDNVTSIVSSTRLRLRWNTFLCCVSSCANRPKSATAQGKGRRRRRRAGGLASRAGRERSNVLVGRDLRKWEASVPAAADAATTPRRQAQGASDVFEGAAFAI